MGRRSELSADRAALLVMQNVRPCITMLMKIASGTTRHVQSLNAEQFLNQARAYQEGLDQKMSDRFYRFISSVGSTHPFPVARDASSGARMRTLISAARCSFVPQVDIALNS